jgi:hypothetical protein
MSRITIKFEPRDLWLGVYWKVVTQFEPVFQRQLLLYVCLIPCFPIIVPVTLEKRPPYGEPL